MKLGDVIELGKSKKLHIVNSHEYTIAGVQSYGLGVINRRKELGKDLTMKEYQVIEKDFLMWCKVDTKNGAFGVTRDEHVGSLASTNMCLAKIDKTKMFPDFLETLFRFQFFHSYITHLSSGTTNRKYLTPSQLCELVDLPDLSLEQQREFLDLAINLSENSLEREITHQLELVKQLRQAFLREAMQGKLVPQVASDEPASLLLQKIKAEKAQLIKEGKLKKEKEFPPIKPEEIPFDIPKNWVWCRLGEIASIGTGATPLTTNQEYYKEGNIPWITSSATNNLFVNEPELFITEKALTETNCKVYPIGTLVVAMYGQGKTRGQITELNIEAATNQACAAIELIEFRDFHRKFVKYFFRKIYDEIRELAQGGAQPNLNMAKIRETIIPLPSFSEQQLIVTKLEQLMRHCDELEQSIKLSQTQNEQLLQQVLREALSPKGKEYKIKDEMSLAAEE